MGKNLIQQARGKGGPTYRAPSFRYVGEAKYLSKLVTLDGTVKDIVHCPGHSAPLARVVFDDGETIFALAVQGMKVNDRVKLGTDEISSGNIVMLKELPEGSVVSNIESNPGDGGKFVRAAGTFGKVVLATEKEVVIELPSKKKRSFNPLCRATIGIISASGRKEKPFMKAGFKFFAMRAKNKLYPRVHGQSMNAVDHPHGGGRSSKKNYPYVVSRHLPPGAKVGLISARRTGRKRGTRIKIEQSIG